MWANGVQKQKLQVNISFNQIESWLSLTTIKEICIFFANKLVQTKFNDITINHGIICLFNLSNLIFYFTFEDSRNLWNLLIFGVRYLSFVLLQCFAQKHSNVESCKMAALAIYWVKLASSIESPAWAHAILAASAPYCFIASIRVMKFPFDFDIFSPSTLMNPLQKIIEAICFSRFPKLPHGWTRPLSSDFLSSLSLNNASQGDTNSSSFSTVPFCTLALCRLCKAIPKMHNPRNQQ